MTMDLRRPASHRQQAGIVLVSALLLLIVISIMVVSIFHSFGLQEKIAGNMREKQRALQAAVSAQSYGEWWLINGSNAPRAIGSGVAAQAAVQCNTLVDANLGSGATAGQICSNPLPTGVGVAVTAWPTGGNDYGMVYTPPNMNVTGAIVNAAVSDVYYKRPRIYITDLGVAATGRGEVYKVDAYSEGLNSTSVAVVESTVTISCITCDPSV
jgi:type IV pilus assembly protein PilX